MIGMLVFLRLRGQPVLVYADALMHGLLLGWCFGRLGCASVHDHPGRTADPSLLLAVGPFPDGEYRYDLGLYEFIYAVVLTVGIRLLWPTARASPGRLTGLVCLAYGPPRFALDFLRAEDLRHGSLTAAQWAMIAITALGIHILFVRRPRDADLAYRRAATGGAAGPSDTSAVTPPAS
jgi:phosphatidylglycerol:prolipoprotein diacylglycerol transferase